MQISSLSSKFLVFCNHYVFIGLSSMFPQQDLHVTLQSQYHQEVGFSSFWYSTLGNGELITGVHIHWPLPGEQVGCLCQLRK